MKDNLIKILKQIGFSVSNVDIGEELFENEKKNIIYFNIDDVNFKLVRIDDIYAYCYILSVYSPIEDEYLIIKYNRIPKESLYA